MNLKEAFRYQNKLQSHMEEAQNILSLDANVTQVENTYLRHKVMADAQDETVRLAPESPYADRVTELTQFLLYLLREKQTLSLAIRRAKAALELDMDSEVSLNALRQSVARTLSRLNELRPREQILPDGGCGYRFNAEGNQVSYRCDIRRVTTIHYDRNIIRAELRKLTGQADAISTKLDLALVTSTVDYTPPFDVNAGFAEAFETFLAAPRA